MLTGTPLDLTLFGTVMTNIGILYWLLTAAAMWMAVKLPQGRRNKLSAVLFVTALFGFMPATSGWREYQARIRLNASMTLFQERCKAAGEKIVRTVDDVDGVVWMKWRERPDSKDQHDQFKLYDPYGRDCGLEDCIGNLLRITKGASLNPGEAKRHSTGYRFVETIDPVDGQSYRYSGHMEHGWSQEAIDRHERETGRDVPAFSYRFKTDRVPIDKLGARYGITWDDISTREDREHWIAGSSLKVVDLQTNEVLGERVGYMVDRGQGSQAGFRSPWLFASQTACPEFAAVGPSDSRRLKRNTETKDFALRVIRSSQSE